MGSKMKNFVVRTLSGAVLLVVVLGAILWSKWSFGALLLLITLGGEWEFYRMAQKAGYSPQRLLGLAAGAAIVAVAFVLMWLLDKQSLQMQYVTIMVGLLLYFMVLVPTMFICELYRKSPTPIANIGATITGVVYVAMPMALLYFIPLLLGGGEWKPWVVLFYIFIIWANDVFAYLFGVTIGRHRLFERISPKKSWEGFFGGLVGAVGLAVLFGYLTDGHMIRWGIMGLIAALTGVAGDLVESMLKREAGVKDSGKIMPGHGGFLDRFDALFISVPFVVLYLVVTAIYMQ